VKLFTKITALFLVVLCSHVYGALPLPEPSLNLSYDFVKIFYRKRSKNSMIAPFEKDIRIHLLGACDARDSEARKNNFHKLIKYLENIAGKKFDWEFVIVMVQIIEDELGNIALRSDKHGKIANHKLLQLQEFKKRLLARAPQDLDIAGFEVSVRHEPLLFTPRGFVLMVEEYDYEDLDVDEWTQIEKENAAK
jgi:hypothetical protein